jgi:hypothetical protein
MQVKGPFTYIYIYIYVSILFKNLLKIKIIVIKPDLTCKLIQNLEFWPG